jgi:8-oxo-dGTP pyrophosphatase MutT (NUDIX family)
MLDLDMNREGPEPRDAATLVVVRDGGGGGVEVFCVQRQQGGFLGGAVVFPGGKLEPSDADPAWAEHATAARTPSAAIAPDEAALRALAVAACRESLEEAAILPVAGAPAAGLDHAELLAFRARLHRSDASLRELLAGRGLRLDLAALHPMARWVTPASEPRRFDARFFLFAAAHDLAGVHDGRETTASFWAAPTDVLRRFAAGELQLAPPTHRTLEVLATARDAADAARIADASCLEPICPRLVVHRDAGGETMALVLPGDPEHAVREPRSPGASRYVLRGDRFLPGAAPG